MSLFKYVPANKDAVLSIFKALHPILVYQNLTQIFTVRAGARSRAGQGLRGERG